MDSHENKAVDLEKARKTNLKLAIGVAAFAIITFCFLYIMMFALMFSLIPVPSLSKDLFEITGKLRHCRAER